MGAIDYLDEPATTQIEVISLKAMLGHFDGNKSELSRLLGTQRYTINQRLKRDGKGCVEYLIRVFRGDDGRISKYRWFNGDT